MGSEPLGCTRGCWTRWKFQTKSDHFFFEPLFRLVFVFWGGGDDSLLSAGAPADIIR